VVTIMPDTWAEVESFKEELRKKKKRKTTLWRRRRPNAVDEETETFSCFDGSHKTTKRGYTIYWIYSTEKKKRDRAARETRLQKVERELTRLMGKLNTRNLKTKAQITKHVGDILKQHDAAQFYHIELTELKEQHTRQVGRGRPGKTTKYKTHYTVIYSLSWARRKKVLQQEQNTDGIFPLLTTDSELSAKKALVAYKYQPRLEKRFQQLKSVHEGAPLLFKKIERIEAIMFLFFLALILQAVIERQVRLKMKTDKIEAIPVYPEDRLASHPTTTKIFDRFYDVSTYRLKEGDIGVKTFKDALTTVQKELLELLEISEDEYWHFAAQKGLGR
jgi:transposase